MYILAWLVQSNIALFCPDTLTEANLLFLRRPLTNKHCFGVVVADHSFFMDEWGKFSLSLSNHNDSAREGSPQAPVEASTQTAQQNIMIFSSCLALHPDFTGSRLSFWEASKYIGKVLSIQVANENSVDLNKLSNCFVLAREGYHDEYDKVCGQNERCRECTRHTRPRPWSRKSSRSRGEGEIDSVRRLCFGEGFAAKVTPDSTLRNENRFRTRGFNFSQSEEIVALNFPTAHNSHGLIKELFLHQYVSGRCVLGSCGEHKLSHSTSFPEVWHIQDTVLSLLNKLHPGWGCDDRRATADLHNS